MENALKLLFATTSIALLAACGGGGGNGGVGGGGTAANPPPVVIADGGVQGALVKIINDASTRQVNFERINRIGSSDGGSGLYTVTPFVADTFRGNSALSRISTISISMRDGPIILAEKEYYDSNYKLLGTTNDFGTDFVTNTTALPTNWRSVINAEFYSADVFSNSSFTQKTGSSVVTWRQFMQTNLRNEPIGAQLLEFSKTYYFPTSTVNITKKYSLGTNTKIEVNELKPSSFEYYFSSTDLRYRIEFQ